MLKYAPVLIAFALYLSPYAMAAVWYVTPDGSGNGTSWSDASGDLRHVLASTLPGDRVWVAAGTYVPDPADRGVRFYLAAGNVAVYGGFSGTETGEAQRNWNANPTVLSGNAGDPGSEDDDCYGIMVATGEVTIDGFIFERGRAVGTDPYNPMQREGAALRLSVAGATVRNCTFRNNRSVEEGGAVRVDFSESATVFDNCAFSGNVSDASGGAAYSGSDVTFVNCRFTGNRAGEDGGALKMDFTLSPALTLRGCAFENNACPQDKARGGAVYVASNATVDSCVFTSNSVSGDSCLGGAVFFSGHANLLRNSEFRRNTASGTATRGGAFYVKAFTLPVENCTVDSNGAGEGGGAYVQDCLDVSMTNCRLTDNYTLPGHSGNGGGLYAYNTMVTATACQFRRNSCRYDGAAVYSVPDAYTGSLPPDTSAYTRCGFVSNDAGRHGGAVASRGIRYRFEDCDFETNDADSAGGGLYHREEGSVFLECAFTDNAAAYGAGSFFYRDSSTVANCTYYGNDAVRHGGGVYVLESDTRFASADLMRNTALYGGGAYASSGCDAVFDTVTFYRNTAAYGGGMACMGTAGPDLKYSVFHLNGAVAGTSAAAWGGGLYLGTGANAFGQGCTFMENTSDTYGGGCATEGGNPYLVSSLFYGNSADEGGAFRSRNGGWIRFTNCTFSGNAADAAGGGVDEAAPAGSYFRNCIIRGNTAPSGADVRSDTPSRTYVTYSCVGGGWSGDGNIDADPRFVDAGGDNYRLFRASPCVDAGSGDEYPYFDLEGAERYDDPDIANTGAGAITYCDMGAYERQNRSASIYAHRFIRDIDEDAYFDVGIDSLLVTGAYYPFPDSFTLSAAAGGRYAVETLSPQAVRIRPEADWSGTVAVPVTVSDPEETSDPFVISVGVLPVNDLPVLSAYGGDTLMVENTPRSFRLNDFNYSDADNWFGEITLHAVAGDHYAVRWTGGSLTSIMPDSGYTGPLDIAFRPYDGTDSGAVLTVRTQVRASTVWYVTPAGNGNGDGGSWADAFPGLQPALAAADGADQVWVAAGTYTPASGSARDSSFRLMNNEVRLYGGFNGTESSLEERDWRVNRTVLSGDLLGDDDTSVPVDHYLRHADENAYHVVYCYGDQVIDGFTVTGGRADGPSAAQYGGGLYLGMGVTVRNCVITGNYAVNGGGVYSDPAWVTVENCVIANNYAIAEGGGLHCYFSYALVNNSTIANNRSFYRAGAVYFRRDYPIVTNSVLWGNYAPTSPQIRGDGYPVITYTCYEGGYAGAGNINAWPVFADSAAGDFRLADGSPCIDAGAGSLATAADLDGYAREDDMFVPNTGTGYPAYADMGAYEYRRPNLVPVITGGSIPDVPEDGSLAVTLDMLLVSDPDHAFPDSHRLVMDTGSFAGYSLAASADTGYLLVPAPDFYGTLTVPVRVADPEDTGAVYEADITVTPVNDAPVISAQAESLTTGREAPVALYLRHLHVTDIDNPENDLSLVVLPGTGYTADGTTVYPDSGFTGTLPVSVRVSDGTEAGPLFVVNVTVIDNRTWYVVSGSTGGGTSWASPFGTVAEALDSADAYDEIRIARGTYYPTAGTDRSASFVLKEGVQLYGGFLGTEATRQERDWAANTTVLSGAIGGAGNGDNSYHVIIGADAAVVDGFTVSGAYADAAGNNGGGGLYADDASPIIRNCTFTGNWALHGAGAYARLGSPEFDACVFTDNSADEGAGLYLMESGGRVERCVFRDNYAVRRGAGIYSSDSTSAYAAAVTNCVLFRNRVELYGGGIFSYYDNTFTVTNCTFHADTAGTYGGGICFWQAPGTVRNSVFLHNRAAIGAQVSGSSDIAYSCVQGWSGGTGNISADPRFMDAAAGDFRIKDGSPCIDAADGSAAPAYDILNRARYDDPGIDNTGAGAVDWADMGAYENRTASNYVPVVHDSVVAVCSEDDTLLLSLAALAVTDKNHDFPQRHGLLVADTAVTPYTVRFVDSVTCRVIPDKDYCGTFALPVRVYDPEDTCLASPVRITVLPVNDAPVISGQAAEIAVVRTTPRTFTRDDLVLADVDDPLSGISLVVAGGYNYSVQDAAVTADSGFTGTLRIPVRAFDGKDTSAACTLAVVVKEAIVWYVAPAGSGDGGSWAQALGSLHDAVDSAAAGEEVWVAAGTYVPARTASGNDAGTGNAFYLKDRVNVYGGFAGTETRRNGRDWERNVTVLSGNRGDTALATDNCVHVVTSADRMRLDGFTVTGGHAGGMPDFFIDGTGGGFANLATGPDTMTIANCRFTDNFAFMGGGAVCAAAGHVRIENTVISGDSAASYGGGVFVLGGGIELANCVVAGNGAGSNGGGIYNNGGVLAAYNCIIRNNTGGAQPDLFSGASATTDLAYSCISQTGFAGTDGNISADPLFVDPAAGDFRLQAASPCIDAGNGSTATVRDYAYRTRVDMPGIANTGTGSVPYADMGVYEYWPPNTVPAVTGISLPEPVEDDTLYLSIGMVAVQDSYNTFPGDYGLLVPGDSLAHFSAERLEDTLYRLVPDADYSGGAALAVRVYDFEDTSAVYGVAVGILPRNDAPAFVPGPYVTAAEDCGPETLYQWAAGITAGAPDESLQVLAFNVVAGDSALFAAVPVLDPRTGDLTFTPAPESSGIVPVYVQLRDGGGTAYGGVDSTAVVRFYVSVQAVNDPPRIASTAPETAMVEHEYAYAVRVQDPDDTNNGYDIAFELLDAPDGMEIDSTGRITWTPPWGAVSPGTVGVVARDGGEDGALPDTQRFVLVVVPSDGITDRTPGARAADLVRIVPNPVGRDAGNVFIQVPVPAGQHVQVTAYRPDGTVAYAGRTAAVTWNGMLGIAWDARDALERAGLYWVVVSVADGKGWVVRFRQTVVVTGE